MKVYYWQSYRLHSMEAESFDEAEERLLDGQIGVVETDLDAAIKVREQKIAEGSEYSGLYREQLDSLMKAKRGEL